MIFRISRILPLLLVALMAALTPRPALAVTDADIAAMRIDADSTAGAALAMNGSADAPKGIGVDGPGLGTILGKLVFSLGIVFGLMWLAVWLVRKYMPQAAQGRRGGGIEILTTRSIGARRSLMLVRVQGRTLLIGATPNAIQTLSQFENPDEDWNQAAWRAGLEDAPAPAGARKNAGTTTLEPFE